MKAFIGLGSNLGDREANIRQSLQHLEQMPETTIVRGSSLYDTEPVGLADQPNFLNGVDSPCSRMIRARSIQSVRSPWIRWPTTSNGLHVWSPSWAAIQASGRSRSMAAMVSGVR